MKTMTLKATNAQKQVIHRMKRQLRLDDSLYRQLIREFSGGRTDSSSELTKEEARQLISRLIDPENRNSDIERKKYAMVCRIYRTSCLISGLNAPFDSDDPVEREMNKAKLNSWILKYGSVKKPVSRQSYDELVQTYRQLKAMEKKENDKS